MLTMAQIERLLDMERYDHLLARVVAGGRCPAGCEMEIARACRGAGLAPAAIGLALQRIMELTYAPCPLARTLAARLIGLQRSDGLWGSGPVALVPSAIALRALLDFDLQIHDTLMASIAGLESAVDRGARALASLQRADGSLGRNPIDGPMVLWQLGSAHMRLPIRFFDLRRAVERAREADALHAAAPLGRLACAAAVAA